MNWCRKKIMHYDYQTRMTYYVKTHDGDAEIFDPSTFRNALIRRAKYHKLINMCVNHELQHDYGLKAQTSIVYCNSNDDRVEIGKKFQSLLSLIWPDIHCTQPTESNLDCIIYFSDGVDESFLALVAILLLTITLSSLYDFYLKKNNLPHLCNIEHYKRAVPGKCKYNIHYGADGVTVGGP